MLNKVVLIFVFSLIFNQDIQKAQWMGTSVSTADNLDAINLNPAGLGVERGKQSAQFFSYSKDESYNNNLFYMAERNNGMGYTLTFDIKKFSINNILTPYDGTIGFGSKLSKSFYTGASWNKHKNITMGFLYRPHNIISSGLTIKFSDNFKNFNQIRFGISTRPFLSNRLTFGIDGAIEYKENKPNDKIDLMGSVNLKITDGIFLNFSNNSSSTNLSLNFNMGKDGIFTSSRTSSNSSSNSSGVGFYSQSQKEKSIFNKKVGNNKRYVRINLDVYLIEEKPSSIPFSLDIFNPFIGAPKKGTQLRKFLSQMKDLGNDKDVDGLIIDLGNVSGGFSKMLEVYQALEYFKHKDKNNIKDRKIITYSEFGLSNGQYILASLSDEIYIPDLTGVDLKGIGAEISFYRGLLDTLSITPEVVKVNYDGKSYKTAANTFLDKKMSKEMKEDLSKLLDDYFEMMVDRISRGRNWTKEKTTDIINNGPYFSTESAIKAGLVDSTMYKDDFDKYVETYSINENEDSIENKNEIINWSNIDRSKPIDNNWIDNRSEIAVIYAVGGIVSGKSNPGPGGSTLMGDKTIKKAIKEARQDKDIKAIVLRIDSGGGSALASDQMWKEIYNTTTTDTLNTKPFIADMSSSAASGGYYIACEADTIVASPATVTGSIGVISSWLNFSTLYERVGITTDSLKRGNNSLYFSMQHLLSDGERKKLEESTEEVYQTFKNKVLEGRNLDPSFDLDKDIAMGRIFTGLRAKRSHNNILVDTTGYLFDEVAINIAKESANVDGDIKIVEFPRSKDGIEVVAEVISSKLSSLLSSKKQENKARPGELLLKDVYNEFDELYTMALIMDNNKVQCIMPVKIRIE